MCQENKIRLVGQKNKNLWTKMKKDERDIIEYIWKWSLVKGCRTEEKIFNFLLYKLDSDPKFIYNAIRRIDRRRWPSSLCKEYEENGIVWEINKGEKKEDQ